EERTHEGRIGIFDDDVRPEERTIAQHVQDADGVREVRNSIAEADVIVSDVEPQSRHCAGEYSSPTDHVSAFSGFRSGFGPQAKSVLTLSGEVGSNPPEARIGAAKTWLGTGSRLLSVGALNEVPQVPRSSRSPNIRNSRPTFGLLVDPKSS